MSKPKLFRFMFLLPAAAILVACGGETTNNGGNTTNENSNQPTTNDGDDDTATPTEPAVLRVGWGGSPDTLNMGVAVLTEAYTVAELVYDSMYQLNLYGTSSRS